MLKKHVIFLLVLTFGFFAVKGMNSTAVVGSEVVDTIQLNNNISRAKELLKTNADSALFYFDKAVHLADEIVNGSEYQEKDLINVRKSKADLLADVGDLYYKKYENTLALKNYQEALKILEELAENEEDTNQKNELLRSVGNTMLTIGVVYFDDTDYTNSEVHYNKALEMGIRLNDSLIQSKAMVNLGMIYNNQGKFDEAINNFYAAIKIFEKYDDKKGIAISNLSIGNIVRKQRSPENAIGNYNAALTMFSEMGDERGMSACYNNLGICYAQLENEEKTLEFYNKAIEIYKKTGQLQSISTTYTNIAAFYEGLKDYNKAIGYIKKSLNTNKENQSPRSLFGAHTNLAGIYLSMIQDKPELLKANPGYLDTIVKYGESSFSFVDTLQLIMEKAAVLSILNEAYALKGNYEKAYGMLHELVELNDSIYNSEKTKVILDAEGIYETEKKEQQIEIQQHLLDDKLRELKNARHFRNLLAIITVLLIIVVALIFYHYRQSKKSHQILDEKNNLIGKQNREITGQKDELQAANQKLSELIQFKERMTGMIVHDLKNPLSNILNSDLIDDLEFREQLIKQAGYDMLHLVQNILDVYKLDEAKMKLEKELVGLIPIIHESAEELNLYISKKNLKIVYPENEIAEVYADKRLLKRVFANLISNAVKYSKDENDITIKAHKIKGKNSLYISVHNIGQAIPKEKQELIFNQFNQHESRDIGMAASTGLGLAFCKMAIESHGGEIGVNSDESGTEFWFTLPEKE